MGKDSTNETDVYKKFVDNFMVAMWYQGFTEQITELLLYLKRQHIGQLKWPDRIIADQWGDNFPVRMLWNTLVLMYGDFDVSPANGWINDIDGAIDFLEKTKEQWSVVDTFGVND